MADEQQQKQEQKPNVIDITKFFGGKTLSSADVRVNKNQVLKTQPSFIAAPELASLLDIVATSVETKNDYAEKIKSVEKIREKEIEQRSESDSKFQLALRALSSDVESIKTSYSNIIETLQNDRKLREQEIKDRKDYVKQQLAEFSKQRVGESLQTSAQAQESFTGQDQEEQPQDSGFDLGKMISIATALAGSALGGGGGGGGSFTGKASDIPAEGKALLDGIAGAEAGDYNVIVGGGTFDSYDDHPRKFNPKLGSDAAGRYQFISTTWDSYKPAKEFTPENQDIAAWNLAIATYGAGQNGIVEALKKDPMKVADKLKGQWPSLPGGSQPNAQTGGFLDRYKASLKKYGAESKADEKSQKKSAAAPSTGSSEPDQTQTSAVPAQQTPSQIAQEESSLNAKAEPQIAMQTEVKTKPEDITPPVQQSSQAPIVIAQQPPAQKMTQREESIMQDLSIFSSTNPDNLFMVHSLRELNLA